MPACLLVRDNPFPEYKCHFDALEKDDNWKREIFSKQAFSFYLNIFKSATNIVTNISVLLSIMLFQKRSQTMSSVDALKSSWERLKLRNITRLYHETVNKKSSSIMVFRTMVKALYNVPQNIPTPANIMMQAISDANGQFPIFSVKAEREK